MKKLFSFLAASVLLSLAACEDTTPPPSDPIIRGLKATLVKETARFNTRLFPSVLTPAKLTILSFKVPGQVQDVSLRIGQKVKEGDLLAALDPTELELALQSAEASRAQTRANAQNAKDEMGRKEKLLAKGVASKAAFQQSQTAYKVAQSQVQRAEKQVEIARDNLKKTKLVAPFSGIIAKVTAKSFSNLATGSPVAQIYKEDDFEVKFAVSYEVASHITIGQQVRVRFPSLAGMSLEGEIRELGASADAVTEFPVVVALKGKPGRLRSGLSAEVEIALPVEGADKGYVLPLTVLSFDDLEAQTKSGSKKRTEFEDLQVFVFDPETQTVKARPVKVGGIRENSLLITHGIKAGDYVASAGVSFLKDGMKVKLLASDQQGAE